MEYLSDVEKSKIVNMMKDPDLVEAVRKVLLAAIYTNGTLRTDRDSKPLQNAAFAIVSLTMQGGVISDQDLGADLRGLYHGINALEVGFKELAKITTPAPVESVVLENPGV